jgi:hypothetical protein
MKQVSPPPHESGISLTPYSLFPIPHFQVSFCLISLTPSQAHDSAIMSLDLCNSL